MKSVWTCVAVCVVLLNSAVASSMARYQNLEKSTLVDNGTIGWGSCVACAGGASDNATIASSPFQSSPSVDGSSRDFYINGSGYSDALWWYKVGPNDGASNFVFDFWVNVDSSTQSAQALEFDAFQFASGRAYMFGTQCDYGFGTWDVWNTGAQQWVHSSVPCKKFVSGAWYHVTLSFHRSVTDKYEHYDSLAIVQYNGWGRVVANNFYALNRAFPSQVSPAGWGDDLGVQFQMDIGPVGAQMQEWVDRVNLTAW